MQRKLFPRCGSLFMGLSPTKKMSPGKFIHLYTSNPKSIRSAKIEPPKLGHPGFGSIIVTLNHPVYRRKNTSNKRI